MNNILDVGSLFGEEQLSVIQNPFNKNKIVRLYVSYRKKTFEDAWYATGSIEFENGKTKGEQNFEADTFDEVVIQMKACINQLLKE